MLKNDNFVLASCLDGNSKHKQQQHTQLHGEDFFLSFSQFKDSASSKLSLHSCGDDEFPMLGLAGISDESAISAYISCLM